ICTLRLGRTAECVFSGPSNPRTVTVYCLPRKVPGGSTMSPLRLGIMALLLTSALTCYGILQRPMQLPRYDAASIMLVLSSMGISIVSVYLASRHHCNLKIAILLLIVNMILIVVMPALQVWINPHA